MKHPFFLSAICLNALFIYLTLTNKVDSIFLIPISFIYPFFGLFSSKKNHNEVSNFYLSKSASWLALLMVALMIIFYLTSCQRLVLISSAFVFYFFLYNLISYYKQVYKSFNTTQNFYWVTYFIGLVGSVLTLVFYLVKDWKVDHYFILSLINLSFMWVAIVYFYLNKYYKKANKKSEEQDLYYRKNLSIINSNRLLEQRLLALGNEALNNQISPHFLFNAMNSINSLIIKKQSVLAETYLTELDTFLKLIRVKKNTSFYSLKEELEMLSTYSKLESLRKSKKVELKITLLDDIKLSEIYVPHLFLQSIIENSFWHGFVDDQNGELSLSIEKTREQLAIEIEDNGVGIIKSFETRSPDYEYSSAGIDILKNRLKTLSDHYQIESSFNIIDRSEIDNSTRGTLVSIIIPLISEPPLSRFLN